MEDLEKVKVGETVSAFSIKINSNFMSIKNNINRLQQNIDNKLRTVNDVPTDMKKGDYIFLENGDE